MIDSIEGEGESETHGCGVAESRCPVGTKARLLVVDDEEDARLLLKPLLTEAGYQVSLAENGRDALWQLFSGVRPDLIILDLRMPVMDGWEFRAIQNNDPTLGLIPVLAISADGSAHATAISAQAYLHKPFDAEELLATVERVLFENERRLAARSDETERLAALGRLAAGVGHEINNPLAFVMMNLAQIMEKFRPPEPARRASSGPLVPETELEELKANLLGIPEMLEDCRTGTERIRDIVCNLQRLSRQGESRRGSLDLHRLLEQSVVMVWDQIRSRAQLVRSFGEIPSIRGDGGALAQVFLNLLVNAAQAIPEGAPERNEIRIATRLEAGELVVEIGDSGRGIAVDDLSHVFEPFFTTKPVGQGTGLGLSVSRQTVRDHGGRMTVQSELGKGSVFRVHLPLTVSSIPPPSVAALAAETPLFRGRVLVVDGEPLIGSIIRTALAGEHDVSVVQRAAEALARLEHGEVFDLLLCDVTLPDSSAPDFYAAITERWPELVTKLVFMSGGAFTPEAAAFMETVPIRLLTKPFDIDRLKRMVRRRARGGT